MARMSIPVPPVAGDVRRFVLTGVGSSVAHARFLAHLIDDAGFDTRVVPISALAAAPDPAAADDVLIVVSQGLSPNARLALAHAASWRRVLLLTAASEDGARAAGDTAKADLLAELAAADVTICPFPVGENEYETLVRVVGPIAGYLCALHVAAALAPAAVPSWDVEMICAALEAAPGRVDRALAGYEVARLRDGVTFLTSGTYGELTDNLRYKVIEGMLLPAPPVWDLLELAHGPLQQTHTGPMTFIALTRGDAASFEHEMLARVERALDGGRHALLRLDATFPGALAIFEHEALMNELMLRFIAARTVDQIGWPGREKDRELYEIGASVTIAGRTPERGRPASAARLESLTWPEIDALLAGDVRTAVVPLGSTEQHGPHLPFATDTWIADELAARFCARVGDAIRCPTIPIGCSSEHLAFPGTLDLTPGTLRTVLFDLVCSLARHGFSRTFIFSAHGGNYVPLADALSALQAAAPAMRVTAHTDLAALTALLHRLSAAFGVSGEASGHHAGEFETSILRAIRPDAVRVDRIGAGFVERTDDPQALFYPSLRTYAPSGVVGDPRGASPARAERYLDGWVELLVAAYRGENATK
jgi:creatinine amidohydrolase